MYGKTKDAFVGDLYRQSHPNDKLAPSGGGILYSVYDMFPGMPEVHLPTKEIWGWITWMGNALWSFGNAWATALGVFLTFRIINWILGMTMRCYMGRWKGNIWSQCFMTLFPTVYMLMHLRPNEEEDDEDEDAWGEGRRRGRGRRRRRRNGESYEMVSARARSASTRETFRRRGSPPYENEYETPREAGGQSRPQTRVLETVHGSSSAEHAARQRRSQRADALAQHVAQTTTKVILANLPPTSAPKVPTPPPPPPTSPPSRPVYPQIESPTAPVAPNPTEEDKKKRGHVRQQSGSFLDLSLIHI